MRALALGFVLTALAGCGSEGPTGSQNDGGVTQQDAAPPPPAAVLTDLSRYEVVQAERLVTVDMGGYAGAVRVELEVDGVKVTETTAAPWTLAWDTTTALEGIVQVRAVVRDGADASFASEPVPVIVANTGALPAWQELGGVQDTITYEFDVPANWDGNEELIDDKFHWTMPAERHRVIAVLQWEAPGWTLDYSIGTGWCPDSGQALARVTGTEGEIVLTYEDAAGLPSAQWFFHIGSPEAMQMKGQAVLYTVTIVIYP